jgi:ADP-ribose pyrophosphatase YjhB (NUDIX family)
MPISEQSTFAGRQLTLTWREGQEIPQNISVSQVSAFCFNNQREVLIVKNKHGWGLPGGHPEINEGLEEALRREIKEEADCTIKNFELIGFIEVDDPDNNSIEGRHYLQLRYLCLLDEIGEFNASFETSERKFVAPDKLPKYISWMATSPTGQAQYQTLIKVI